MNLKSTKLSGFTLTELMVVIVILCCLATWVPFAWLTPDKPKDLKAIEHLRGHLYMHQLYFTMFRSYPSIDQNTATPDADAYARLVISKNPALSPRLFYSLSNSFSVASSHSVPISEAMNNNLNQLNLTVASGSTDPVIYPEPQWAEGADWSEIGTLEFCKKNSPIGVLRSFENSNSGVQDAMLNCHLDSDQFTSDRDLHYRSVTVGNKTVPMYTTINGNDVMIEHRCLGLMGASGAIYLAHIGGGETLSTSHIPSGYVTKLNDSDRRRLLASSVLACEDGSMTIEEVASDSDIVNVPLTAGW